MLRYLLLVGMFGAVPATATSQTLPRLSAKCPIVFKSPEVKTHINKAKSLIGKDLPQYLIRGLSLAPRLMGHCAPPGIAPYDFDYSPLPPTQAFDQLFWVGSSMVGTWILKTDAGLIMFDAMNNSDDAAKIVEPGIRQLGLDPANIKYIVVTHGHSDHWGGSKYFQDKYGTKVLVGKGDGPLLKPSRGAIPPRVDGWITDGMKLQLGSTTMRLFLTPGHTPGSISAIFPVTDHGVPHEVGLFGGFGLPPQLQPQLPANAGLLQFERSVERLRDLGEAAGVDTVISTHPFFADTIVKAKLVSGKRPKKSPWVIGRNGWVRYMNAVDEVAKSYEAMLREHPEAVLPRPHI
jgi:metallo-beta-lactamase class B